jgi:hypothetical protein
MNIPTAEEFWKTISPNEKYGILAELKKLGLDKHIYEVMRRFTRLHVKEALKTALDETPYGSSTDTVSYEDCVHILDCYPPENIK